MVIGLKGVWSSAVVCTACIVSIKHFGTTKAQVNEVQAQTQTKIDVDFETDPCKCYIKAGTAHASVRDK